MIRSTVKLIIMINYLQFLLTCYILGISIFSYGQTFTNVTDSAGVSYVQYDPVANPSTSGIANITGGAAAGDYDNDGWVDLFVTRLYETDILFRNKGDGTFEDVSTIAGFNLATSSNCPLWCDLDNDGDSDLYITTVDTNRFYLYMNNGDGTFTEDAVNRGVAIEINTLHNGMSASVGDFDRDGWLDIHTSEWGVVQQNVQSSLFRNKGSQSPAIFDNVTMTSNLLLPVDFFLTEFAFAARFVDLDNDGWQDLAIAADFGNSILYWNNADGTFSNGTQAASVGTDENGMGSAIADYDGDGLMDWFITSIFDPNDSCGDNGGFGNEECSWGASGNRLYKNMGNRTFTDITDSANVRDGGWGWGCTFLDYDNDSDLDIVMTNGMVVANTTFEDPYNNDLMRFWQNNNGVYTEVSQSLGITSNKSGKGLLTFDYDNDGDLDIFVTNNTDTPDLYRNDSSTNNNWIKIKAVGRHSNKDAIGTRIKLQTSSGGSEQFMEVSGGNQFLSQSDRVVHFGLGNHSDPIFKITLNWPSGIEQVIENSQINTLITINEPSLTYDAWIKTKLTPQELTVSNMADATANPDNDEWNNFLEYVFNLDPKSAEPVDTISSDYLLGIIPNNNLEFNFDKRSDILDINYNIEYSENLTSWQNAISMIEIVRTEDINVGRNRKVHFKPNEQGLSNTKLFFRLNISSN